MRLLRLLTIAFAVFLALPAAAQMYKCTAKDGTVLYQARPCVGTEREATLANGTLADGAVMNAKVVPRDTERAVLEPYAPAQLDAGAVDTLIDEAFAATGASGPQDMGKVMGFIMGKAKGQVDGGLVQQKVKERLG